MFNVNYGFVVMSAVFFICGLCVGSFINVINFQLPLILQKSRNDSEDPYSSPSLNSVYPLSHCLLCHQALGLLQLMPVVSWLLRAGRCKMCCGRISFRFPFFELLCGLLFAAITCIYADIYIAISLCFLISMLLPLFYIDMRYMLLPDMLTFPLLWSGLLWSTFGLALVSSNDALWGAASGYLILWMANGAYRFFRTHDGMGYGDFKLLAALGAWTGTDGVRFILILAPLLGLLLVIFHNKNRKTPQPFGPALILSAIGYLLFEKFSGIS